MADFANRILPVDIPVARRCAAMHVPDPRPKRDAMIAATALVHGFTIVTRETADYRSTGNLRLNPWETPPDGSNGPGLFACLNFPRTDNA